jgi:hypothetical protein
MSSSSSNNNNNNNNNNNLSLYLYLNSGKSTKLNVADIIEKLKDSFNNMCFEFIYSKYTKIIKDLDVSALLNSKQYYE